MEIENDTNNNTNYPILDSNYTTIYIIIEKIKFYTLILTISIGIPGNIISILIFIKPSLNNKTNTGFLYTLLCALNLFTLLYNSLVTNSYKLFQYDILLPLSSEFFIKTILLQTLSWSQVLITFDRFIAVMYPIKGVRIMSKRWVLYSIILGIFLGIIGLNSPYFIRISTYTLDNITYEGSYILSTEVSNLILIIRLLMQLFVPYLIVASIDLTVIVRLRKLKTSLSGGQSTQANNGNSKNSRLFRNTIFIDLIYLIFNFASTIVDAYCVFSVIFPNVFYAQMYFEFIMEVFILFPYIYSSLLFIMFIIFNSIFRAEFIALLRCFVFFKTLVLQFLTNCGF